MTVYLVGAGPGDPDLLTLRAARLLGDADVVIFDRLVSPAIMDLVAPWAILVDVGKDPNGSRTSQETINELLISHGRSHDTVVRLKGGDPFIFGRGGEEALALKAAHIAVEMVPGISSSMAGPAVAGIPVTHRHVSSGFTVITGHQDPNNARQLDWDALARLGTTLVVLMGARQAARISARLQAASMPGTTPVAIITEATTPLQNVQRLTLAELGQTPVPNPSIIVIGDVADADVLSAAHHELALAGDQS